MAKAYNVKEFGAVGDGVCDDSAAIQKALDAAEGGIVVIPAGEYRVGTTLRIGSERTIHADTRARIFHCEQKPKKRGDFLLSNSDPVNGNWNITVCGGTWDGNFDGKNNDKPKDLFDPNGWSGAMLNFQNVFGLKLCDMTLANSVTYYVRMSQLDNFRIEKIRFRAERLAYNQDGLHFGGECRNGVVKDIRAVSFGETNDDMIALNADDSMVRIENHDLVCGPIENIEIDGVYAENCFTVFRLLSVNSPIRNIKVRNVDCGFRNYAINMDAARYCRTPLVEEEEFPNGCGCIENVQMKNIRVHSTREVDNLPMIMAETRCKNFSVTGLEYAKELDADWEKRTLLRVKNLSGTKVTIGTNGSEQVEPMNAKSDVLYQYQPFDKLKISSR